MLLTFDALVKYADLGEDSVVHENTLLCCPKCGEKRPYAEWDAGEDECDLCGGHLVMTCPSCGYFNFPSHNGDDILMYVPGETDAYGTLYSG